MKKVTTTGRRTARRKEKEETIQGAGDWRGPDARSGPIVYDTHKVAPEYYDYAPEPMTVALESEVKRSVGPRLGTPDIPCLDFPIRCR